VPDNFRSHHKLTHETDEKLDIGLVFLPLSSFKTIELYFYSYIYLRGLKNDGNNSVNNFKFKLEKLMAL